MEVGDDVNVAGGGDIIAAWRQVMKGRSCMESATAWSDHRVDKGHKGTTLCCLLNCCA